MPYQRTVVKRLLVGIVSCFVIALGVSACADAYASPVNTAEIGKAPKFTGQELYLGVVLGAGDVGTRLGNSRSRVWSAAMSKMTLAQAAIVKASEDTLLARVGREDPAFFDRFAKDMQSGDVLRTGRAEEEAVALTKRLFNSNTASLDNSQRGCLLLLVAVGVVVINVAVALNVDIWVNFVTAQNIATASEVAAVSPTDDDTEIDRLRQDEFARLAVLRLSRI